MSQDVKKWRNLAGGLAFLAPNILGFLAFMLVPLVFSMALAFSNWDLRLHNMFHNDMIRFIGLKNFSRLLHEPEFLQFLGNTLFLMIGTPFAIGGSLLAAILLTQDLKGGNKRVHRNLVMTVVIVSSLFMAGSFVILALGGMRITTMAVLLACLTVGLLLMGVSGGKAVYRTLFYMPSFTSGVAVYILWKKMYNSQTGPVNTALAGPLNAIAGLVNGLPPWLAQGGMWLALILVAALCCYGLAKLSGLRKDGAVGWMAVVAGAVFLLIPVGLLLDWCPVKIGAWLTGCVALAATAMVMIRLLGRPDFHSTPAKGIGTGLILSLVIMMLEFVIIGLGLVGWHLPALAKDGLQPPNWLSDYYWAKPAIMIMGLWGAIGSNNMLLYIAGLSNIPPELYEAADIDGASNFQRFWNITWPQLAPVTFFIFVMSVIGGLQGGFEMARTMTQGGPAGATTTLSYFIYTEGFGTGRLGFASAVAWALFALVFVVTIFNWKFGSKYVNE